MSKLAVFCISDWFSEFSSSEFLYKNWSLSEYQLGSFNVNYFVNYFINFFKIKNIYYSLYSNIKLS